MNGNRPKSKVEQSNRGTGGSDRGVNHSEKKPMSSGAAESSSPSDATHITAQDELAVLNALPANIAVTDQNGVILTVNESWRRFASANLLPGANFCVGQNYLDVCEAVKGEFAPDAQAAAAGIRQVLRGEAPQFFLEYPCHSETERRWFRLLVAPLQEGPSHGAVLMHINITERKLAEEAVRESEERFRGTFEQAAVGMALVSVGGSFIKVNDKLCSIIGYEREELLGKTFMDLTVAEDQAGGTTARQAMLAGVQNSYSTEKRYRKKNGEIVWLNLVTTLKRGPLGEPKYFISVFEEITDRKRAEQALAETESKFRQLVERSLLGIYIIQDGRLVYVNPMMSDILGYSKEELAGLPLLNLIVQEERPKVEENIRRRLENEVSDVRYQTGMIRRDGQIVQVEVFGGLSEYNGRPAILGTLQDVTERKRTEDALRRSDQEHRQLVEQLEIERSRLIAAQQVAKVGSWETELSNQSVIWSEETHRIFETDPATFRPTHEAFLKRVHPEDRLAVDRAFLLSLNARSFCSIEHRLLMPDGRIKFVEERWRVFHDDTGQPTRAIGTCQDITDRKYGEIRIKETEERYRALFERSLDAIYLHDLRGRFVDANPAALKLLGYEREDIGTLGFDSILTNTEDVARAHRSMELQLSTNNPEGITEYQLKRKDGTLIWVELVSSLVFENGTPVAVQGIARDITERKLAEERLREQATLLDKAQDAILVRDLQHHVTYWNKSAERVYGWTAEEVFGRSADELLYRDSTDFTRATEAVLRDGEWVGELEQYTKSGRKLTVEGRWTLVRDNHGRPKSILAINTDITEKRKIEAHFLRTQRMESIGTLAGGIAHDLNNMLAPIVMSVELLKDHVTDEEGLMLLGTLEESAQRGANLVKQVLTFARGVEGQRVAVNPLQLLRDLIKVLKDTFPKSINVRFLPGRDVWTVIGDPTQLHQVILNLCVNARDAMPRGGNLTVTVENTVLDDAYAAMDPDARPGSYVMVKVADTGTGIPRELHEKIFEPFFTTKEVGKGTGLGLSTASAIVKSHGGFIHLHSEVGKGTDFTIYFPAETAQISDGKMPLEQASLPHGNGELILVVDDEEAIRKIVQNTLDRFGYRTVLAANGAEGVSMYVQHQREVAAVLTDMVMPIMDGPAMIIALKALNPQVRIIASSGYAGNSGGTQPGDAGVEHFIPKPYTAETVLTVLKEVLRSSPSH